MRLRCQFTMLVAVPFLLVGSVMAQLPELTIADIPDDLPPDLRTLIEKTFSDKTIGPNFTSERHIAVEKLGEMHERAAPAVPFLIRLLNKSSMVSDSTVEEALAAIGEPAVEPLIASGKTYTAPILLLGKLKDKSPRALDAIIEFLQDENPGAQRLAALAFNGCDDPRATLPLIELLDDSDEYGRKYAAECFHSLHDPHAVEPLLKLVESKKSRNEYARRAAITALGYQRDRRAMPTLLKIFKGPRNNEYDRSEAAIALGRIGDESVIAPLSKTIWNERSPLEVRKGAVHGLAMFRDEKNINIMLWNLYSYEDTPFELNIEIVKALAEYGDPSNTEDLLRVRDYHGRNELAFWAAMSAVELSDGAIDDIGAVRVIQNTFMYYKHGMEEKYVEEKRKALQKIAENGTNLCVRQAAKGLEVPLAAKGPGWLPIAISAIIGFVVGIATMVWFIVLKCRKSVKECR